MPTKKNRDVTDADLARMNAAKKKKRNKGKSKDIKMENRTGISKREYDEQKQRFDNHPAKYKDATTDFLKTKGIN